MNALAREAPAAEKNPEVGPPGLAPIPPIPPIPPAPPAPIDPAVFATRRQALLAAIGPDAVAVVTSLPERLRNGDAHYRFRQHSDVYYLTGFEEPQAVVVLRGGPAPELPRPEAPALVTPPPAPSDHATPEQARFIMFVRPRDAEAETWDGRRAGIEGARSELGADAAYPIAELGARLGGLLTNRDELHYAVGLDPATDALVMGSIAGLRTTERRGKRPPRAIVDPLAVLHELRLVKGPEELDTLRRAAAITCAAHVEAMRAARPGVGEWELEALVDYTFRRHGGNGPGYTSIVGAGANATVLHYIANRSVLRDGDLVLIDAGCEVANYTADVTRTFPVSGRFTPAQRDVYQLVLSTQQSAIAMVRPGVTIEQLYQHCARLLTAGMIELGLLAGSADERFADGSYRRFFPHGTSHWLGLDVHDAGAYNREGRARPLLPGMVITIEPGLYVPVSDDVPAALRGIGVRIEDDLLVTADGHDNLTAACPKALDDIEAACS